MSLSPGTRVGPYEILSAGGPLPGSDTHTYAISRDGRLLVVVRPEGDLPLPLSVVLNWKFPR